MMKNSTATTEVTKLLLNNTAAVSYFFMAMKRITKIVNKTRAAYKPSTMLLTPVAVSMNEVLVFKNVVLYTAIRYTSFFIMALMITPTIINIIIMLIAAVKKYEGSPISSVAFVAIPSNTPKLVTDSLRASKARPI